MIQTLHQSAGGPVVGRRGLDDLAKPPERVGARFKRRAKRFRGRLGAVPVFEQRPRAKGEPVVFPLRGAGLFGSNPAWRQDEAPFVRHATRRAWTHRNETKSGETPGLAGQNRGVVFAAAVSADTRIALQGAEAETVLDAGVITGHVEWRT